MQEHPVQQQILAELGSGCCRLWRNNTGTLMDRNGRPVKFGLCKGSSDLIGLRSVVVTPEMVGQRLAVFSAVEVKPPKGGRVRPEQQHFIEVVQGLGGLAGVARSVEDAERILRLR